MTEPKRERFYFSGKKGIKSAVFSEGKIEPSLFAGDKCRGVAQSGLAHLHGVQGVAGSNPVAPTRVNRNAGINERVRIRTVICHGNRNS